MAQVPGAHGRYILSQAGVHSVQSIAEILSKRFPQYKFSSTKGAGPFPGFDTSKVRVLCSWLSLRPILLCSRAACMAIRDWRPGMLEAD